MTTPAGYDGWQCPADLGPGCTGFRCLECGREAGTYLTTPAEQAARAAPVTQPAGDHPGEPG